MEGRMGGGGEGGGGWGREGEMIEGLLVMY